jgi:hypothetical protein
VELYDLRPDPSGSGVAESLDTSAQEGEIVASLQADLSAWMAHTLQVARDLPRAAPPAQFDDAVW